MMMGYEERWILKGVERRWRGRPKMAWRRQVVEQVEQKKEDANDKTKLAR